MSSNGQWAVDISSRIKRIYNLEKWFNKTILLTERYIKTKTYHRLIYNICINFNKYFLSYFYNIMNYFSTLGLGMHKFILKCFLMNLSNVLYL
jgi:hypothetical protein